MWTVKEEEQQARAEPREEDGVRGFAAPDLARRITACIASSRMILSTFGSQGLPRKEEPARDFSEKKKECQPTTQGAGPAGGGWGLQNHEAMVKGKQTMGKAPRALSLAERPQGGPRLPSSLPK